MVGRIPPGRCVLFDVDGVLVDSSARLSASLAEVGARSIDELRDPSTRSRFWEVFLSEKYIHLDRPNPTAVELLRRRREEGYGIVVVTGRPYRLSSATLRQLDELGVPYDAVVFRFDDYFGKDREYKLRVLEELGIDAAEAHDDSPEVCRAYSARVERVYCWRGLRPEEEVGEQTPVRVA